MDIAYLLPVGSMPTIVSDIGAWYNRISPKAHSVRVMNLREALWDSILSKDIAILKEADISNVLLDKALKANYAAYSLKQPSTFLNAEMYIGSISRIGDFMILFNMEIKGYSLNILHGIRIEGLDYEDTTQLLNYSIEDNSYCHFIKNIIDKSIKEIPDLILTHITCLEELLNLLIIVNILRKIRPDVHVCLTDFSYEAFSLKPYTSYIEKHEIFRNFFDTIIRYKHEKDLIIPCLIKELSRGERRRGFITYKDFSNDQTMTYYDSAFPMISCFNSNSVLSTRLMDSGCYWGKCTFCNHNIKHEATSFNGEVNICEKVDRLEYLYHSGYKCFIFSDEAMQPQVLRILAREIIKRDISIKWVCRCRVEFNQDYEFFKLLKEAGCIQIIYGLESVSPSVIERMNKYQDFQMDKAAELFSDLNKAGIGLHVNLIVGFPGEKEADAIKTMDFVLEAFQAIGDATFQINPFALFTGSKIASNPEEYGLQALPKKGDIIQYRSYKYLKGDYKDIKKLDMLISRQLERLYEGLGWHRFGSGFGARLAVFMYFNSGHGITFKTQEINGFANALYKKAPADK